MDNIIGWSFIQFLQVFQEEKNSLIELEKMIEYFVESLDKIEMNEFGVDQLLNLINNLKKLDYQKVLQKVFQKCQTSVQ